ncbi:putative Flagellar biosynthetic protein fliR [Magnetospira sp. QH-2]|nr:putative Flagellar biosynthetic protein fliR [Magnetospira sp. QH-2]
MVAARIGGAIMLFPGFSATYVPMRVRVLVTLMISLVVVFSVSDLLPPLPNRPGEMFRLLGIELLAGVFMGVMSRIIIGALQTAGTIVSLTSAMANAFTMDAVTAEQGAIVTSFLMTVAMTLIFVTDLHHLMLIAVVDSYTLFLPGVTPSVGDMANLVTDKVAEAFVLGVRLAGPYLVLSITYNLGLGLMTRLMPSLPVFFVAMPLQLLGSIFLMMVVLPGIMLVYLPEFQATFTAFMEP